MNNIVVKKLKCGVNVCLEKNDYVKSVALGIFIKAGSINENTNNYGISHFIEHMLFKGTSTMSAKEIAESTDKIGAQVNAYTSYEHTCYHVKSMSEYIYSASDVLFSMLNDSIFDEIELNRERNVIYEEMKMTEDTPDELCHETVCNLTFDGTPYGHSIIGTKEILSKLNREDLHNYKNKEYTKDSIVVSVCGNFDVNTMLDYLESKFNKLEDKKEYIIDFEEKYSPKSLTIKKDITQSHVCIATPAPKYESFDKYKLAFLNEILGGSMSSRLFQNIREEKGLCYSVFSLMQSYQKTGIFEIYGGVSHDNIDKFMSAIKEEFDSLNKKGITKDEFDIAYIQIKSSLIYSSENIASNMFLNGKSLLLTGKLQTRDDNIQNIEKVNLNDLNSFAHNILVFDNFDRVVVTGK